MVADPDLLVQIEAVAVHCVEDVHEALGFELDYAVETLPVLDHYCRGLDFDLTEPEALKLAARKVGTYFGEVLRRSHRCRWHVTARDAHLWRLEFESCFLFFNPIGVAIELLSETESHGWNATFVTWPEATEALVPVLDRIPAMSESDYYCLATRHEVLETVLDFLMARRAEDQPTTYGAGFYEEQVAARQESAQSGPHVLWPA